MRTMIHTLIKCAHNVCLYTITRDIAIVKFLFSWSVKISFLHVYLFSLFIVKFIAHSMYTTQTITKTNSELCVLTILIRELQALLLFLANFYYLLFCSKIFCANASNETILLRDKRLLRWNYFCKNYITNFF